MKVEGFILTAVNNVTVNLRHLMFGRRPELSSDQEYELKRFAQFLRRSCTVTVFEPGIDTAETTAKFKNVPVVIKERKDFSCEEDYALYLTGVLHGAQIALIKSAAIKQHKYQSTSKDGFADNLV